MSNQTYSFKDLIAAADLPERTVRYYMQHVLGPNQGTKGSRASYPKLTLDKLRFIKMLKEGPLQLSLSSIRQVLEATPDQSISDVADGLEPLEIGVVNSADEVRAASAKAAKDGVHKQVVTVPVNEAGMREPELQYEANEWESIPITEDCEIRVRGAMKGQGNAKLNALATFLRAMLKEEK